MTETTTQQNAFETSGTSPPGQDLPEKIKEQDTSPLTAEERKQNRTVGLRIFDVLLYPIFTNIVVFGLSAYMTYMTTQGNAAKTFRKDGLLGGLEGWSRRRGEPVSEFFQNRGMNKGSADMAKTVAFSFLDGSLIAPFVKLFEDRREQIGKKIDEMLGTKPKDERVYEAEPKQTWGTVLKGRFATLALVLPTAVALDKIKVNVPSKWDQNAIRGHIGASEFAKEVVNGKTSLNNRMFRYPGIIAGSKAQESAFGRFVSNHVANVPEAYKVGYFEAFYTTLCTVGLYFGSRIFARKRDEKIGRLERDPISNQLVVHTPGHVHPTPQRDEVPEQRGTPETTVRSVQPMSRVQDVAPTAALQA